MNVVLVREIDPPGDDVPVEWVLLTNLPIDDAEQVRHVIEYYCVRWMIEIAFRTLKSGCRIQQRRFEDVDRFSAEGRGEMVMHLEDLFVMYDCVGVCKFSRKLFEVSDLADTVRQHQESAKAPDAPPAHRMPRRAPGLVLPYSKEPSCSSFPPWAQGVSR